jgi:hypothetical protein
MTMPRGWSDSSKSVGVAARAATASGEGAVDLGRHIVYNGPVLFDLMITFWIERSFTDKPNGSNSIEHQLSVVKQRTERRLSIMSGANKILLR